MALEQQRQLTYKCPDDVGGAGTAAAYAAREKAAARKTAVATTLLALAVDVDPGNGNAWLQVQLVGTRSNRDGIGARLSLDADGRRQVREVQSGTSFLSQNSLVAHFGLDKSSRADQLTVRWPSGVVQELSQLPVNQKIMVTEPG